MTTTVPTHEERAIDFAAAVREHLADLPEAELDELLDGLHADLAERLKDGGELGDPQQYAAELRQAAGLPERGEATAEATRKPRRTLREVGIAIGVRIAAFWAATPGRRAVRDFVLSLAPVWWVLRGLVLAQLLLALFGSGIGRSLGPLSFAVLIALVVLSVQWGRGAWASKRSARIVRAVAQTVAVVLVLPVAMLTIDAATRPNYVYMDDAVAQGLSQNGSQITNIFAFDCTGTAIDGVQLFDQNGQPITTLQGDQAAGGEPMWGFDEERQQNITYGRNELADYSGMWNVFPLQEGRARLDRDPADAKLNDAKWPLEHTLPSSPECVALGEPLAGAGSEDAAAGATIRPSAP